MQRSKPRSLLTTVGYALVTAVAFMTVVLAIAPKQAIANSVGCGPGTNNCFKLIVNLSNTVSGTVTVEAIRQGGDLGLDDSKFPLSQVPGIPTQFSSVNTVYGTDNTFPPCDLPAGNPGAVQQLFTITVKSGTAVVATLGDINLCQNISDPKVTTNGNIKVVQVNTPPPGPPGGGNTNPDGGITGRITYQDPISPTRTKNCEANSLVEITDAAGKKYLFRIGTPISSTTGNPLPPGSFDTGFNLPPGTYTVYVGCTDPDGSIEVQKNNVVVVAGQITNIGNLTPTNSDPITPLIGGGVKDPVKCEDYGNGLSWVFCPMIRIIDGMLGGLEKAINDLLSVDRLYGNTSGPIYQLWATVRNISLLVLIPMMMLMVIGTAIDMGPFDPYTVKKALPRMVYAAIFILLSWSICTFFIDMSDVIGAGIVNFLTNVGADGKNSLAALVGAGASTTIFEGVIMGTTLGFATGALSFGIVGSLALVTGLTFLMGYLALLFRQMLILGLLVFAPAAILVWIFPGNDKLWTIWKTSFIGLIVVYPVVGAMIGMGRVAANIVSQL